MVPLLVDLTQLLQTVVAEAPGDYHHRTGELPAIATSKMIDQQARLPAGRGAEHQGRDVLRLADDVANRFCRFALANDDVGLDSALVEDFTDRGTDHALDPEALLFLDRRLHGTELHEVLRFDDPQHL